MRDAQITRRGLTLMELVVVLVILVALAGIVVPLVRQGSDDAREVATRASLKTLRDAVLAYVQDMKGVQVGTGSFALTTGLPRTLADLQIRPTDAANLPVANYDPITRHGWRGPYLTPTGGKFDKAKLVAIDSSWSNYGDQDQPAFLDAWRFPIVLQFPASDATGQYARLVSAGPAANIADNLVAVIDTPRDVLLPTKAERGNDIVAFIRTQDLYP